MNSFIAAAIFLVIIKRSSCTMCLFRTSCNGERLISNTADGGTVQTLSGDLQLLIPAWRFTSNGHVSMWEAIVQGSAADDSIEFQIFRPAENAAGVRYNLVYGNRFNANGGSQSGSIASLTVGFGLIGCSRPEIPVRPGDVVGIRLRNTNIPSFGLQYSNSTTGPGVDVYYWQQGMDSQACTLSICDSNAVVLSGIIPLVSWRFCPTAPIIPSVFEIPTPFEIPSTVETLFQQYLITNPLDCTQSSPPFCPLEPSQTILTIPNEPQPSDPSPTGLTTSQMSLVEVPSPRTAIQNANTLLLSATTSIELMASSATPQVTTTLIETVINTSTIMTEAMIPTPSSPSTSITALTSSNIELTEATVIQSSTMVSFTIVSTSSLPITAITSSDYLSSSPDAITINNLVVSTTHSSDASSTPIQTVTALMPFYLIIIISLAVMCVVFFVVAILTVFIVLCMKLKKKEKRVECGGSTEISPQLQGRLQVSAADSESAHTSLPGIAYDYSSIYESLRSDQVTHAAATHIVVMNENSAYGVMDQDNKEVISTYVNVAYNVPLHQSQTYY